MQEAVWCEVAVSLNNGPHRQRPWSNSVREVGSRGEGATCVNLESWQFLREATGRLFTSCRDFLHRACTISRILVKKSNWFEIYSMSNMEEEAVWGGCHPPLLLHRSLTRRWVLSSYQLGKLPLRRLRSINCTGEGWYGIGRLNFLSNHKIMRTFMTIMTSEYIT